MRRRWIPFPVGFGLPLNEDVRERWPIPVPDRQEPVVQTTIRKPTAAKTSSPDSLSLALAAARTAAENRGQNIVILDIRAVTTEFDYFVIATGTSRRQLRAMSEEIDHTLEDDLGDRRLQIEGFVESRWIVLDYGSVVIHLFDGEARKYYDLENLWAEAQRVELTSVLKGPP